MISELFRMAVYNLSHRKMRTFLTILGVVIGVAAIVGMVGATAGINEGIMSQVEKFQSNMIDILPGQFKFSFMQLDFGAAEKFKPLTESDVNEIKKISGVETATGDIAHKVTVMFGDESAQLTLAGVEPSAFRKTDALGLLDGRYLEDSDDASIVLGYSVAYDLFKKDIALKKKITIEGKEYKVVGIMKKAGGFFQSFDSYVYIPKKVAREQFGLDKEKVSHIVVRVAEEYDIEDVGKKIEEKLCKAHKSCDEKDFTVITPEFSRQISSQIVSLMSILMGGIAAISLVVGSIGIANMMYTSVVERTREIGILKAIGAANRNIMILFLLESGIIGIVGGIVGVFFGYVLGEGFLLARQVLAVMSGFATEETVIAHMSLSPFLIIGAILLSLLVGILSGVFPARKAAKLQPVEALRYE